MMELSVRNLAFLLSTAGEEMHAGGRGEREGRSLGPGLRGRWTRESEGKGETTYFGLKNTLGAE